MRDKGGWPAKDELLNQDGFRIEIQGPEIVFFTQDVLSQPDRNPEGYLLDSLEFDEGLFSKIIADLATPSHVPMGYALEVEAHFRNSREGYWRTDEIDQLQGMLSSFYPAGITRLEEAGVRVLSVDDQERQARYFLTLGFQDETQHWLEQVRAIDQKLRNADLPSLTQVFQEELQYLTENSVPLPNTSLVYVGSINIGADPFRHPSPETVLRFKHRPDFVDKLNGWVNFANRAVNVVYQVKGNHQAAILTI